MTDISNAELYRRCMVRIKHRIDAANTIANQTRAVGGIIITTEILALQIRKILEGIALAGLCAHRQQYKDIRKRLEKEWQLSQIAPRLDQVNPHWYPTPLENEDGPPDPKSGARPLITIKNGVLTKSEFIEMHGRMGQLLHEDNPIVGLESRNWEEEFKKFPDRLSRIMKLINKHEIQTQDGIFWIVQIHVVPDNRVVVNEFTDVGSVSNT